MIDKKVVQLVGTHEILGLLLDGTVGLGRNKFGTDGCIDDIEQDINEIIEISKDGDDMNIGFNPKFLIDALRAIDSEEITLYLVSPKAPCFIRDVEETYCYLILPVNFITID